MRCIDTRTGDAAAEMRRLTDGRGADVAVEAVGLPATVRIAVESVRKGGALTLVGNLSPKVDLPLQSVVTREITLYGSCASRGEYPACLDLMAPPQRRRAAAHQRRGPARRGTVLVQAAARSGTGAAEGDPHALSAAPARSARGEPPVDGQ